MENCLGVPRTCVDGVDKMDIADTRTTWHGARSQDFFGKKTKTDLLSGNAGVFYGNGDQVTGTTERGGQGETA